MKKSIMCGIVLSLLITGCATKSEVSTKQSEKASGYISVDENGMITDEISIMSITEDKYLKDMERILTEDGYTMRIEEASELDKISVKSDNVIYFGFDSTKITREMEKIIQSQLQFLNKYPKIKVIIEGHTDEKGSNAYNVILGEKRANEVKKMLTESGISESQIEVISYGEMKPLLSGATKEINDKNRRAVFVYE